MAGRRIIAALAATLLLHVVRAAAPPKQTAFDPVKIHGFLMYASIGFLFPVGILIARFMKIVRKNGQGSSKQLQIIYYLHLVLQTAGVAVMTGGAVFSFRKFGYDFGHTHQRLGLCLWILAWLQPIIGFLRPNHGVRSRPLWYAIHWLLGTGGAVLGFVNLYIGMKLWELINKESIRTLNIAFSVQVSVMALLYFVQDRWDYLLEQGRGLTKPIAPPSLPPGARSAYTQVPTSMEYQLRHYLPS